MPFKDPEKRREYHRQWMESRPGKQKQYDETRWAEHRDRLLPIKRAKHTQRRKDGIHHAEWLRYKYGITREQFFLLLTSQDGKCGNPGCRVGTPGGRGAWHVDHDHATGKIRGLLCSDCNLALGQLKDDPQRILGLRSYLEAPPAEEEMKKWQEK